MALSKIEQTKPPEGSRRRKPAFTRRVIRSDDSGDESQNHAKSVRKPNQTRRIVSTDSDSDNSLPDALISQPSTSRTPIDNTKTERPKFLPTAPSGTKKTFVRASGDHVSSISLGFGSERAIMALTGLKDGFVFQLKKGDEKEEGEGSGRNSEVMEECNSSLIDNTLNGDIPPGTIIIQPEAAPDGEEDWYRSKEFRTQFTRERRERREKKETNNQHSSNASMERVFCTACNSQVNPFDKKTLFCHPVLNVIICKRCNEFYNSGPWKLDSEGIEEQCRWCGEGGNLTCCDYCPRTFCKPCITRNLGRGEWSHITSQKKWRCYVCEPSPLTELVAKCSNLLSKFGKFAKMRKEREREKEKEKEKVFGKKKVQSVKVVSSKKKSRVMPDAAIAEEFLQYLVGNISNKALFIKSLVRLKKEVPAMQKLQMNLSLKHIGEVKSILADFEASINYKLNGDVNKSDSALDGTEPEDCESPERSSSKTSVMTAVEIGGSRNKETEAETTSVQQDFETSADRDECRSEEMDTAATSHEEANLPDTVPVSGQFYGDEEAMDTQDSDNIQESEQNETEADKKENLSVDDSHVKDDRAQKHLEKGTVEDLELAQKEPIEKDVEIKHDNGDGTNENCIEQTFVGHDTDIKLKPCKVTVANIKTEKLEKKYTGAGKITRDSERGVADSDEDNMQCSQQSPRKLKVTPRSRRLRSGLSSQNDEDDDEAKLMSMIDASDVESSDESDGSSYDPHKSARSSKKSTRKEWRALLKEMKKSSRQVKEKPASSSDSDEKECTGRKRGPGQDSSNEEGESGFNGIPGDSSVDVSQDEVEEKGKTKGSRRSKGRRASEFDSSDLSGNDQNTHIDEQKRQGNSRKRLSRKKSRNLSSGSDSLSEDEKDLKRLERISTLKRKRKRGAEEDTNDKMNSDEDEPLKEKKETDGNDGNGSAKDTSEEMEMENESIKKKKEKKSPLKTEAKSKEFVSSDSSSSLDESDICQSDDMSPQRSRNHSKRSKKEGKKMSAMDLEEKILMDELDNDEEEEDDDDDEEEEVDGAGSKRSKKRAQKRAEEEEPEEEEDEDWENSESRQNGRGGEENGSEGEDRRDGDDDEDEDDKRKDEDYEEEEEDPEENGEDEDEEEDEEIEESDDGVVKKKTHPLLRVKISGSSEEGEDEEEEKKKKKTRKGGKGKNAKLTKKGKAAKRKKKKKEETDTDYFTSSESDDIPSETPKRKRVTRSQTASSTEESAAEPKKSRKKLKREERNTSSEADSSKESKPKKKARRGKGKKRRRIKVASDSESEEESKTQDDEKEEDEAEGGSDEDETGTPKKGRKQIRRVLKKSKLQAETQAAELEEQERRKRIEEKRKEIIGEEDEKAEKSAMVTSCILEKGKDSDEIILEVDEELVARLKPHQADGVRFLFDSTFESVEKANEKGGGCILAHCMGLGKTLQVITYLHTVMTCEDLKIKTCLVVAPLNTVLNWEDEFEKWIGHLDSDITVYEMSSVKNNYARADMLEHWFKKGGVMIMGYAMYRNLSLLTHVRNKKQKASFRKTLVDPGPDIVVCDEGHMLKNESSAISKAMNSIKTRRRICLTGTPLQNNLIEYHCMVHFVKPNLLGTMREFKNRFVNPITNGQHSDSTPRDVKIMKRRAHVLHNLLSGCVQRKDYSALTKFLPPKHEYVISIRLCELQIKLYERFLSTQSGRKEDGTKTQATSLFADYQCLMNVWTHPRLLQLATEREDRNAAKREMDDFVTSEEEDDDEESLKDFVVLSDSDLEDPWKSSSSSKKKAETSSSSKREKPSRVRGSDSDSDDEDGDNGGNSDSSVEVVKSWNTRSRARESGLSEGASTSAAEIFIPPEPTRAQEWYSELYSEDDAYKIELSGKLVLLFEILKMAESVGEKVLVFSQSLLALDMIEDMLAHLDEKAQEERANGEQDLDTQIGGTGSWIKGEDYFRMDGSTPAHLRRRWSEIFNDLEHIRSRLFLISTRAGSLGINLIAANRVIIFDANWNPSHDIQSIFRVYRFGQERAVFIYRFIAQGTMEEKIYDRQVIKQSLSQRVVDEHQIERHFTSADLSELYNFTPDRLDDPNRPERPTPVLPKDYFLAELLKNQGDWIVKYHEHDSLLENLEEEELTEEERQEAWKDYDAEKKGHINMPMYNDMDRIYQEGESILRMGEMMLNYPGHSGSMPMGNNLGHPSLPMGGPSMGMTQMQRVLEMQSMYRAQMQQQQRQEQMQREQQQLQQRLMMLQRAGQLQQQRKEAQRQQAGQLGNSSTSGASRSESLQHLQQIAQMQQQQQRLQQIQRLQRLQQQQQQQQQREEAQRQLFRDRLQNQQRQQDGAAARSGESSASSSAQILQMLAKQGSSSDK